MFMRVLALIFALAIAPLCGVQAAPVEGAPADPVTGFALGGYDPAAYMLEGRARLGRPGLDAPWGGRIWSFANEGNRAAFLAAPHLFAPRFGGFSPFSVASGLPGLGDPRIWTIRQGQLYLFRNPDDRSAFEAQAEAVLARAEARWPDMIKTRAYREAATARRASSRLAAATKGPAR